MLINMKSITNFSLSVLLLILLTVSLGTAHEQDEDMRSGHMNSDDMVYKNNGFEGYSDHMKIGGLIQVTDGVKLTISVLPSDEMNTMKIDHMGSSLNMEMFSNIMTVSLTKLVEFEDLTNNGFTPDDLLISEFIMNQTTMGTVEFQEDLDTSNFSINSLSNVINITVNTLMENGKPYAFKWSLDINYPFAINNTKLAVLHQTDTVQMSEMMQSGHQGFTTNMMTDNHEELPMFFIWDEQYTLDGSTRDVVPNLENDIFSLSFDQGAEILYDPQIGIDPANIQEVDTILSELGFDQFWGSVGSPTELGISLGFLALVVLFVGSRVVKPNKK